MIKPIIQVKENATHKYKNCFKAYALDASILFVTDLSKREFDNLLDGKYTTEQIQRYEETGNFKKNTSCLSKILRMDGEQDE
jgi:hypothetical protein